MSVCSNELGDIWPDDVYVVVGGVSSDPTIHINNGDMSVTIPAFAGWKVRMIRGGLGQFNLNPLDGDTYYNYTSITGEFTFSQQATLGEKFIFMAYKPAQ